MKVTKEQWTAALRSGEYKQGNGYLLNAAGNYCCLGVLCSLAGVPDDQLMGLGTSTIYDEYPTVLNRSLPQDFKQSELYNKLGENQDLSGENQDILAGKNDNGQSFGQIADWIEEHL